MMSDWQRIGLELKQGQSWGNHGALVVASFGWDNGMDIEIHKQNHHDSYTLTVKKLREIIISKTWMGHWFHKSAIKVHTIFCDSLSTLAPVFVEHGERCGVQHAMHGCECGQKAFVWLSSMPLCPHSSQRVLFVENHGVVWVHNAHRVYPPCCHTTCFHQSTMVGVSSSNVCHWAPCPHVVMVMVVSQACHH